MSAPNVIPIGQASSRWPTRATAPKPTGAYDPDKFITRASDDKGHTRQVTVRMPTDVYAQLQAMVHSPDFPDYDSPASVIRDSLYHLLNRRREQLSDPRLVEAMTDAANRMELEHVTQAALFNSTQWQRTIDQWRVTLVNLEKVGAWDQMDAVLDQYDLQADKMATPYDTNARSFTREWRPRVSSGRQGRGATAGRKTAIPAAVHSTTSEDIEGVLQ